MNRYLAAEDVSSRVRLRLLPSARCLYDEPVQVQVAGLKSRQVVTLRATATDERGVVFSSSATYRADGNGEINLDKQPSLGGSYVGVEPMGLLWSLRSNVLHQYFCKNNALQPHLVKFSVHEDTEEGSVLAKATNERFLIGDGVSRLPINDGNFEGVLFTPPGEGPFPAVLDLCTVMSEKRASLLANKGFVVLVVAVYTEKSYNVSKLHLDRFEEAVDFLRHHPKVGSKGIGITSRSKAGDIALSLAAFVPGVEVVVWINGCSSNIGVPLYYKKRQILSPLPYDLTKVIPTESGANSIRYILKKTQAEESKGSLVPIERATGRFLFLASEDDLNWDSKGFMDEMVQRLRRHGKDNFESACYPRAGHLLEPPYGPHCPSSFHALARQKVVWGGEPKAHIAAEVQMWKKIQEFLRTHLRCDATKTRAKL